ncbi:class I adenylate-forming enzyme family protein [Ramlibacter sp.]|uniref:class I adenylate-forming enzyme family protein n=1 Tax=Ramlibacter sp. TaxID=1917967 RepID=UPI0018182A14|nr:class I adenylate-forming enzyme family protein [Ramlibacter sp.]MBA2672875.1 acyl--CoA ligase [Ramlibacter sp.]
MNIVEPFVRQALADPGRPALVIGDATVLYGQLLVYVRRLAARLQALGVQPGDRVAVSTGASGGNVALALALAHIGAVSVALEGGVQQYAALVERLGVNYIVHSEAQDKVIAAPSLKGQFRFDWLLETAPEKPQVQISEVAPDAVWRIVLSSGTTGLPKGVALGHRSTLLNTHLTRGLFPVDPSDRLLLGMHANLGFSTHYWMRCLHVGACVTLMMQEQPQEALQLLYNTPITLMATTPALAMGIAVECQKPDSPYSQPPAGLKRLNVGGGKLSPQLRDTLRQRVCANMYVNYGATETSGAAIADPQTQDRHPESAGRLVPWAEIQAVDEQGQPLPPGREGRLRFRSPTMATGYVGVDAEQAAAFRDGWFYSNDMGAVTAHGYLVLAGRTNDVINIMGNKIDPERLEKILMQDAAILDCVLVDIPAELGQTMLAAVVVAPNGFDQDALLARCAAVNPSFQPRFVVKADVIPRNSSGKVMRAAVRQKLIEAAAAQGGQQQPPTLH